MNVELKILNEWIGKNSSSQIVSFACLDYLYFMFCYLFLPFLSIIFLVGSWLENVLTNDELQKDSIA